MIYGVDTSHWDGVIDWLQIREDGRVKFAIHKATEGINIVDSQYANNKAGCQATGIPWGAYHFFRAQYDPLLQARWFYNVVGMGCYVYVVDVETAGDDLAGRVKIFCEALKQLGAPTVMIYTGPYFWHDNVGNVPWAKDYDLWIANYGVNTPMIPLPWTGYRIWQYSDKGQVAGIDASVDENWLNGDVIAVDNYFKNGNEAPEPMRVKVNVANLTIRSAPVVNASTVLGFTTYGKIWIVEDTVQDEAGRNWYRCGQNVYIAGWLCEVI